MILRQISSYWMVFIIWGLILMTPQFSWGGTALGDLAVSMQPGTWAELTTNNINSVLLDTVPGGGGHILPFAEGIHWDPITRKVYYIGSDDPGDGRRVVSYSEQSNSWTVHPDIWTSSGVAHEYDLVTIDPVRRFLYTIMPDGDIGYKCNLDTGCTVGTWTALPSLSVLYSCCEAIAYVPELQGVIYAHGQDVFKLSDTTNAWSTISSNVNTSYHAIAEYNPVHKITIFGGGNDTNRNFYKLSSTGVVTQLASPPINLESPRVEIIADPVSGLYLVFYRTSPFNFGWYTYNPITDVWVLQSNSGVPSALWGSGDNLDVLAAPIPMYGVIMLTTCTPSSCTVHLYKHAPSIPLGGYPMPSVEDEKNTYRKWGWTWTFDQEPNLPAQSTYSVLAPDIHGDTESDDLWAYTMMCLRGAGQGYCDRAAAWARYFRDDYRQCLPTPSGSNDYCFDRDNYIADHTYGWGLIAYYRYTGDLSYLTAAENIAADVEARSANINPGLGPGQCNSSMAFYGPRKWARHLLVAVSVAEANPIPRWIALRDKLINCWINSPDWDSTNKMYWEGQENTDGTVALGGWNLSPGTYSTGFRKVGTFQVGILAEALFQAYRNTGRNDIAQRLVDMANYIDQHGIYSTLNYSGSDIGRNINSGTYLWRISSSSGIYTTSLVNTLVMAYKITGNIAYYNRAQFFFNRAVKSVYDDHSARCSADTVVCAFVDTRFDSSSGNFYLDRNKGELQYTYLLFENGGLPSTDTTPPFPPTGLVVK